MYFDVMFAMGIASCPQIPVGGDSLPRPSIFYHRKTLNHTEKDLKNIWASCRYNDYSVSIRENSVVNIGDRNRLPPLDLSRRGNPFPDSIIQNPCTNRAGVRKSNSNTAVPYWPTILSSRLINSCTEGSELTWKFSRKIS